jgi:DNA invertase Pin-like site-specific DNA recombinase
MTNSLVVRKGTSLEKRNRASRAAQYVRMSTDKQQYSIQNQAAFIAAYAHAHHLEIVKTYADEAESGLLIKNRGGLKQLIRDISAGEADFGYLLVYDVSRWGRFQDIDESAHYEFLCREAGVKIQYCAEMFDNDGSVLSSIVKSLKRVMAAEYSRELSVKVHTGACRMASFGFKIGGRASYALERELVDEKMNSKGVLKDGDRKYLITDHVRLRPGSTDQGAVVRWIFRSFLRCKCETEIADELTRKAVPTHTGNSWSRGLIGRILRNEQYVGNLIYNRHSAKLGGPRKVNSPDRWVRSVGSVEPIIDEDTFRKANKIIRERRVDLSEQEMLSRLRQTLLKEGRLCPAIIDRTVGLPCTATFMQHFGTLRNAYDLVGYKPKRNYEYFDQKKGWLHAATRLSQQVAEEIEKTGARVDRESHRLQLQNGRTIGFRIARWTPGRRSNHAPYWRVQSRELSDWNVAIRLVERSDAVLDYLLLPPAESAHSLIRFSEAARVRRGIKRFQTVEAVVRSVSRYAAGPRGIEGANSARRSTRSKLSRSRKKSRRVQR